jgi:CheY-like chemotaxis protein
LLSNAIKYTPDRGRISISLKRQSAGIIIEVQDNGLGIPDSIRDKVFTPFFQANPKQSRFAPGLGLGLSIVRKIVELHGGGIAVISLGSNNGSRFIVSLPSLVPEGADDPQASFAVPALPGRQADHGSRDWTSNRQPVIGCDLADSANSSSNVPRVLIVDDDHDTAETLSRLLSMDGYETRIASTGLEAIALFRQCHPKFVLLDIGLPELDGYEVAKRLRQETPDPALKIIAVSGWGAESDLKKGIAAGFDAHLVKPICLDQLLTHLHSTNAVEIP